MGFVNTVSAQFFVKSADFTKNLRIVQKILKNKVYLVKYFRYKN